MYCSLRWGPLYPPLTQSTTAFGDESIRTPCANNINGRENSWTFRSATGETKHAADPDGSKVVRAEQAFVES